MAETWKLTVACTKAEAEAIDVDSAALAAYEPLPVLMTSEGRPDDPDDWRLEAYFEGKPDAGLLTAVRALVHGAEASDAPLERIADADWVTVSQAGLEPVRAAQFYVHTAHHAPSAEPGIRNFQIEASRAFGTGHHETTTGCLVMLDALRRSDFCAANVLDLGTGTGLLAFAALHLWPQTHALATDIDPIAIEVTSENAVVNGVPLGPGAGRLSLSVADGTADPLVVQRAPYDLIIANILAGPLIDLAPDIAQIAAPGSQLVLAGLLGTQASAVVGAYRKTHYHLAERLDLGDWAILRLRKRR